MKLLKKMAKNSQKPANVNVEQQVGRRGKGQWKRANL